MADPTYEWRFDPRLNIDRLILHVDPDRLTQEEKTELALRYQEMAAQIPAQVKASRALYTVARLMPGKACRTCSKICSAVG